VNQDSHIDFIVTQTSRQGVVNLARLSLADAQWAQASPFCPGKKTAPGRTGGDGRTFLEAVLWIARTGSPWRDLPAGFGNWNSVFQRIFEALRVMRAWNTR
jgi:transposase